MTSDILNHRQAFPSLPCFCSGLFRPRARRRGQHPQRERLLAPAGASVDALTQDHSLSISFSGVSAGTSRFLARKVEDDDVLGIGGRGGAGVARMGTCNDG